MTTRRNQALLIIVMSLTVLLAFPSPAAAQSDQAMQKLKSWPAKGDLSVAGSLGVPNAFDNDFDNFEPTLTGTLEWHLDEHLSLRVLAGFTDFDADINGNANSAQILILNGNAVYAWPKKSARPYVTGGVGMYDQDFDGPAFPGGGDIHPGINAGGGCDIALQGDWSLRLEGWFHGFAGGDEPDSFFSGTVGLKYRF